MSRPVTLRSLAVTAAGFTSLSGTPLRGDFTLHNPEDTLAILLSVDGGATSCALAPGATIELSGVDLSTVSAKAGSGTALHQWTENFAGGSTVSLPSGFQSVGSGIGAAMSFIEPSTTYGLARVGLAQLSTGTATNGRRGICINGTTIPPFYLGQGEVSFEEDIYVPTLSDGTDTFTIVFGLADDMATTGPANAATITYSHGTVGGNFAFDTFDNGSPTAGPYDTGVALAAGTWRTLKVAINADATLASFYIDGVLVGTRNSNIPTANGRGVAPILNILKAIGTNARTLVTDTATLRVERPASGGGGATLSIAGVFGGLR